MQVIRYACPVGQYAMYPRMNGTINRSGDSSTSHWSDAPKMNISQTDEAYTIQFAVPGYKKEQFQVTHQNNELLVKASVDSTEQTIGFARREFLVTSFEKRFKLGDAVASDLISAKYKDGILSVLVPKRKIEEQKEIDVKVN